jgi:hypothetical protein
MGASCSHPSRVAPAAAAAAPPPPASVTVLWDVENLPIPRRKEDGGREYGTAGDLGEALLAHCLAASGAARAAPVAARLVCVHPERYPMPLKNSLRTRGVQMLDAGSKRGAVDTHLKNFFNDAIVDALLEGARGPAASGGRWMWLASGDADFAGDVRRARRCGFRVGIIHGAASSADYTEHADASVKWEAVLAECERRVAEKRSSSGGGGGGGGEGASASGGSPARGAAPAAADEPSAAAAAAASCTSPEAKAQAALPVEGASGGKGGEVPLCRNFSSRRGCTARHCRYRHAPPPQEPAGAAPLQP